MRLLIGLAFVLLMSTSQYASVEYTNPCQADEDDSSLYFRDIQVFNLSDHLY